MKFCQQCNNMYYIKISDTDENQIVNYCRNCGFQDTSVESEGTCVLKTQFKKKEQQFSHIINKYTKLDPTLPRLYNLKCPNEKCDTNHAENTKPAEIIYIRYDDDNLKYVYICVTCDTNWTTDDNSTL